MGLSEKLSSFTSLTIHKSFSIVSLVILVLDFLGLCLRGVDLDGL